MNQKKLIEKIKEYPLVVLSVVVLLICALISYMRGDLVVTLQDSEADLYKQLRVIEKNTLNANRLAEDVEIVEKKVEALEEKLFERDQVSLNTNFFYSLEDRVDVLITQVSQTGKTDAALAKGGPNALKGYEPIIYDLRIEATFIDFLRLLYELHASEPLIRVADFQMSQSGSAGDYVSAGLRVLVLARLD